MTEDQIKAIAEEYAMYVNSAYLSMEAEKEALRVLQFVNDRYCIVEREKVMKEYREIDRKRMFCAGYRTMDYEERTAIRELDRLRDLFGTSMFHQNE